MREAAALSRREASRDRFTGPMFFRGWRSSLLASFGWALSDMADAVVLGQHLGTVGLAAIALILPVYMINCTLAHGLGMGGSVEYASQMARGNVEGARKNARTIYAMGLMLSVLTAALGLILIVPLLRVLGTTPADGALFEATRSYLRIQLMATPLFYFSNIFNYYLRNEGVYRLAGIGSVVGNVCDIGMNFLFVLGLGMGTGGAALATALGQIISIGLYLPGILRKGRALNPGRPGPGWLKLGWKRLSGGMAVSVSYLYQMIFFLLVNNLLMRLGGEEGIAVFDILQNTSYLILYLYEGTARAMQPIAATYFGEHNLPGQRTLFRVGFSSGMLLGTALIAVITVFPQSICLLFGVAGSAAEALACRAIRIFMLSAFFAGFSILACNFLQAVKQPRYALLLETLRGAALLIPLALACSALGLENFWWFFPLTEFFSLLIVAALMGVRWRQGRLRIQRMDPERVFRRTILSDSRDISQVSQDLEEFCDRFEAAPRQKYTVMMTVEELGEAILKHGFQDRNDGYIQITVLAVDNGGEGNLFELHLRDDATAFDPFSLKGGEVSGDDGSLDATGILMIRKRVRSFNYHRFQGFNSLIITA